MMWNAKSVIDSLTPFLRHLPECERHPNIHGTNVCTCGLEKLLAKLKWGSA